MSGHAGDTLHYHGMPPNRYGHKHPFLHIEHEHDGPVVTPDISEREGMPQPQTGEGEPRTFEYFVQGEVFEDSGLGDGSGWFAIGTDWVTVEASNWREARALGRRKVQEQYPRGIVHTNRRDNLYPFTGEHCRLLEYSDA